MIDTSKITRIEIISQEGRRYVNWDCKDVELSLQDDNRTLKIFMKETVGRTKKERLKSFREALKGMKMDLDLGE